MKKLIFSVVFALSAFFAALRLGERYIPGFLVGCVRLTGYSDRGAEFCREVEPGRGGI